MKYFYTDAPLDGVIPLRTEDDYSAYGMLREDIVLAVASGFQQMSGDRVVTLFPVRDEELLRSRISERLAESGKYFTFEIIDEARAVEIRDELIAKHQTGVETEPESPSDEDLYRASVLKLLNEIKMGGVSNV